MPRIVREAEVRWEGNLARGVGTITAATSGAFTELGFSVPTRIGSAPDKTSPEELLAAAHGGCFGMSLAGELTKATLPPTSLALRCEITMDEVEDKGHQIVRSRIAVAAVIPGADEAALAAAARAADEGCSFSTLLRNAGVAVEVTTTLEEGAEHAG